MDSAPLAFASDETPTRSPLAASNGCIPLVELLRAPNRECCGVGGVPFFDDAAGLTILHADCAKALAYFTPESIDAVITSPPYDDLREYGGQAWCFDVTAKALAKVLKPGGVIVWIVGDAAKDWSESLSSFKQAIYFVEECGLRLLDTMIYEKGNVAFARHGHRTYPQSFEFMFVFSKGRPKTFNLLRKKNIRSGETINATVREKDGSLSPSHSNGRKIAEWGARSNVWRYTVGKGHSSKESYAHDHPAIMPEQLAVDHVMSWTNPCDVVLDPFCGAGTVLKMARAMCRRAIGIEIEESYCRIAAARCAQGSLPLGGGGAEPLETSAAEKEYNVRVSDSPGES